MAGAASGSEMTEGGAAQSASACHPRRGTGALRLCPPRCCRSRPPRRPPRQPPDGTLDLGGRHRRQHLVVVPTGQDGFEQRRLFRERRPRGRGQRHARSLDLGGDAGHPAEFREIARETIRHIHRGRRMGADGFGDRVAGLRQQITVRQMILLARPKPPALRSLRHAGAAEARARRRRSFPSSSPDRRRAHRQRRTMGRAAPHRTPRPRCVTGPSVRTVSPPSSGQPKCIGIRAQPARERLDPRFANRLRQRERQQKAQRPRALGGQIGEIDAQRLFRNRSGGSSGKKCTPATIASTVSTKSQPGGGVSAAASSVSANAPGCFASGLNTARSGGPRRTILAAWRSLRSNHLEPSRQAVTAFDGHDSFCRLQIKRDPSGPERWKHSISTHPKSTPIRFHITRSCAKNIPATGARAASSGSCRAMTTSFRPRATGRRSRPPRAT